MSNNELTLGDVEVLLALSPDEGRFEDSTIFKLNEQVLQEGKYRTAHKPE
jgi:hypothetical protein